MAEKTVRFESELWQAGFTPIPNLALLHPELDIYAHRLYALLSYYAREKEECFPGQERLAKQGPMSERKLRDATEALREAGLLKTKRRQGTSMLYTLTEPDSVPAPDADPGRSGTRRRSRPASDAGLDRHDMPPNKKQSEEEAVEAEEKVSRPPHCGVCDEPIKEKDGTCSEDCAVEKLCAQLAESAEQRTDPEGARKTPRYPVTKTGRVEMRRLLVLDGRPADEVAAAITWVHGHRFWKSNIFGPDKLRSQYDRLRLQAQEEKGGQKGRSRKRVGPSSQDLRRAADEARKRGQ